MAGCLKRVAQILVVLAILIALFVVFYFKIPVQGVTTRAARTTGPVPITPAWALECWVWEDDVNTEDYVNELLAGYKEHDIPARTILIDSPWTMRYNDFDVDEKRYPNPKEFFAKLQADGYRVVLWMTSCVDGQSKDTAITDSRDWYEEAKHKGYLLNSGKSQHWWKGDGGFVDYRNPEAMKWWRGMQQDVFDWGLDGWKLDGAEVYAFNKWGPLPTPWLKSAAGTITLRDYTDDYYNNEYQHGLSQNPEFITLARSIDFGPIEGARQDVMRYLPEFMHGLPFPKTHPDGFAPLQSAPVTWVGDNKHEWAEKDEGIEEALRDILQAARNHYGCIGSDVGGYTGGSNIPPHVYIRWAQFSTFCGLFLNGGHGERRLWMRTPDELEIIRKFAWLHNQLVPYIYSALVEQHNGGPVLMRPTDVDYQYEFGDSLFIAPIHEDKLERTVTLPEGKWRYWFDDKEVIDGPKTFTRSFPMDEFPAYVREGSILPMKIERDYTGIGQRDWEAFTTFNIYPGNEAKEITYHHTDGKGETHVSVTPGKGGIEIQLAHIPLAHILRVRLDAAPKAVERDGTPLPADAWQYDAAKSRLVIKAPLSGAESGKDWKTSYRIMAS